jgi:RimJ/RimL family protein N-acetyltransferase
MDWFEHDRHVALTGKGRLRPAPQPARVAAEPVDDADTAYPRELEHALTLDNRAFVRVRPIRPADEPRLIDLYDRLSRRSAYQRFFTVPQRLPADWAHHFANVDYRQRLALVAEHDTPAGVELVGVGRYEPTGEEGTAEVALVIQDGWQGHGLGADLLDGVIEGAAARGIGRFRAYVLADNERMLRLLAGRARILERKVEDGIVEITFTSREARPGECPLRR